MFDQHSTKGRSCTDNFTDSHLQLVHLKTFGSSLGSHSVQGEGWFLTTSIQLQNFRMWNGKGRPVIFYEKKNQNPHRARMGQSPLRPSPSFPRDKCFLLYDLQMEVVDGVIVVQSVVHHETCH